MTARDLGTNYRYALEPLRCGARSAESPVPRSVAAASRDSPHPGVPDPGHPAPWAWHVAVPVPSPHRGTVSQTPQAAGVG